MVSRAEVNSSWFARTWMTEDGLPEHTIVGLGQTPDGYLWVATHRSLSRFDGVKFVEFSPVTPAGPDAGQIRAILVDRQGRLWLAKDGGAVLCIATGKVSQVFALPDTSRGTPVRGMAEDRQGGIWVSDGTGAVFRIIGSQVETFGTSAGLPGQGLCWLTMDAQGQLWFSQAGHIGVFKDGRFVERFVLGQQSERIAMAQSGGIWLCSGLKLFHYQEGAGLVTVAELKSETGGEVVVTALHEDKAEGLWIGTSSGGLFRSDDQGLRSISTSHPNIINICEDSEGNVWVGTRGGGLNRLSPRAVRLVGLAKGLPFAAVQSACEDANGTLWVVGQNGALARGHQGQWTLVSSEAGWSAGAVACVTATTAGDVLLGAREKGIFRLGEGGAIPLVDLNSQLPNLAVRSLYARGTGELWVAVSGAVAHLDLPERKVARYTLPAGVSDVRTMVADPAGDLWLGTTSDGQLLRVRDGGLRNETTNVMGVPRHIRCLQIAPDGSLWFGFAGQGLGWFRNGKFFLFRAAHGLWDEYISQILSDDRERLWLACNRGIYQVGRPELEAVAAGRSARLRSTVMGRGEGVPNLQATFGVSPAAAPTRDGRLLMPMLSGLAIVEPKVLPKNSRPPPVIVEHVSINGRAVAAYDLPGNSETPDQTPAVNLRTLAGRLRVGPGVSELEFGFTALGLTAPENITFRYQLEGLDRDWVDAGNVRVVRYPEVPPRDYRFRVSACNHDGVWNEAGAVVLLTVAPQIWETFWFRITGAVIGVGTLAGAVVVSVRQRYRRRLERLEQQRALERERTRIAQDLHDDLGAGLVEINFGSELAQDTTLNSEEVREHAREIGARAREMVTALDEIVWAVNPKHDDVSSLATYFCQFAQHFLKPTAIRCHLEVDKHLPEKPLNSEQRHSLFMAFKEALSNAARHSGASDVWLTITASGGRLRITVRDNGRGYDPAAPRDRVRADGLDNMQERLHRLGGGCEITSRPGQGASVSLVVPLATGVSAASP